MKKSVLRRAEILAVGTELLIGDIVNTNAAFLSRRLAALGIGVYRQAVVGDNPARLAEDLAAALSRADLVITTGGLGPTRDDLTKETVATMLGLPTKLHQPSLDRIAAYFAATGRTMTENNRKQAMMPEGAIVFPNDYGTAPALAVEVGEKVIILLPGPPRELEPLFDEQVEPYLLCRTEAVLFSRNVQIAGIGESAVETLLPPELMNGENPTVAPYCSAGELRLRVTARAADKAAAAALCDEVVEKIKSTPVAPYIYGIDLPSPEAALIALLAERGLTIATAESCTGGLIAKRLTDISGSSAVVAGGAVTYQTQEKTRILGVPAELIERHDVVSDEVARAMAVGAREVFGTDVAVSTTGFAGPGGGTERDPVGTVYIAVATKDGVFSHRLSVSSRRDRAYIRTVAATYAILDARAAVLGQKKGE